MPHQCIRCNKMYEEGAEELLKGCSECGGRFFFYIRPEHLEKVQKQIQELKPEEKEQIEQDIKEIIKPEDDTPVILDLECINVPEPGKYEIDIRQLLQGQPIVYKMEDGKYVIDVASSLQLKKKKD